jgi:Zn finger protein HypA/HybF involved in hydrogenase expression
LDKIKALTIKPNEAKKVNVGNQRKCNQCNKLFISTTNANTICPDCKGIAKTKREKTKKSNYRTKKKLKKK